MDEETKNRKGKGGKCLEIENIFFWRTRKRRKIFGEKHFFVEEKEKEANI